MTLATYLLDTNILIYLLRGKKIGEEIGQHIEINHQQCQLKLAISFVTVGEMLAFALKSKWGEQKQRNLNRLLYELEIVDHVKPTIMKAYANINYFTEKKIKPARPMGQNDIWIAATTQCLNAWLITTDKDFDHLYEHQHIKGVKIDARNGSVISRYSGRD